MNVEIFVHGVPYGESFWGKDNDDRDYFGVFYDQSCSDRVKFFIQTRSYKGKTYCYYNYLVYKDVIANDGRSGSYFGLSIRLDAYCKDFMSIYKMLDIVFSAYVLNKILKVNNGKYTYLISKFKSELDIMESIYDETLRLFKSMLVGDSFCNFEGFNLGGDKLLKGNLYEMTIDSVEKTLRQYGCIAISPYYQTNKEKNITQQYDIKLQETKQQYEDRLKADSDAKEQELNNVKITLSDLKNDNNNLKEIISNKENAIKEKDKIIADLNDKIQHLDQTKKVIKNINSIKGPIFELADILDNKGENITGNNSLDEKNKTISVKRIVLLLNLLLTFFVLLILLFKPSSSNNNTEETLKCLHDSILNLSSENEELKATISYNNGEKDDDIDDNVSDNNKVLSIDVSNYDETKNIFLEKNKEYEAIINNATTVENSDWHIDGGELVKCDGKMIKFKPTSEDVVLKFKNENGEKIERKLKVK